MFVDRRVLGEDFPFDYFVSNGLVQPPPSRLIQEGLIRTGARLRDLDVREMKAAGATEFSPGGLDLSISLGYGFSTTCGCFQK